MYSISDHETFLVREKAGFKQQGNVFAKYCASIISWDFVMTVRKFVKIYFTIFINDFHIMVTSVWLLATCNKHG